MKKTIKLYLSGNKGISSGELLYILNVANKCNQSILIHLTTKLQHGAGIEASITDINSVVDTLINAIVELRSSKVRLRLTNYVFDVHQQDGKRVHKDYRELATALRKYVVKNRGIDYE